MINTLATIMLVCMGVAHTSVAPIYSSNKEITKPIIKEPKKATTEYTLKANWTQTNTDENNTWQAEKWQAYNSNYALEVRATTYFNYRTLNINGDLYYQITTKYNGIENDDLLYGDNPTQMLIVIQITPYNYNVETEETTRLHLNLNDIYNVNLEDLTLVSGYYLKGNIYQSTETTWANYLGQQLTQNTTRNIIDDIKNINNGYYYKHEVSNHEVGENYVTITEDIEYTPNKTNYIVINYIPFIEIEENNISAYTTSKPIEYKTESAPNRPTIQPYIEFDGINIIPSGTYEVVDIPGMMFQIIGMPFAFISTAFNLTIFPGTPYQLNISNLILAILAVILFTWLITKVVKR